MTSAELPMPSNTPAAGRLLERADLLSELHDLLPSLAQGHGRVVALSGEAGIGKTSVLRAFIQSASEEYLVLQSGCEDLMTPRPLGPLFDIADLLDPNLVDMLADGQQQAQVLNHLLLVIQRNRKPVILIIEDIHWADDATLDLVKFLGRRAATLPLLLLVSHRDDEPGSRFAIGRILGSIASQDLLRISLKPLSQNAVAEMARVAGRDLGDIHNITNGNPFFVTEILASRAASVIPGSVRDAVWARLERCTIEQRVALEAFSIIPGGANRDLLVTLVTPPQAEQLDTLIDAGMLASEGKMIRFRHELARQSVLQLLPASRKRNLHRAAADWLGRQGDAEDLPVLAQRIHHASAAGDGLAVVQLGPDVARRAARVGAHKQAAQFLALALHHADGLPAEEAAQLYESWSYESGLAEQIDDKVIEARHKAIELWSIAGRSEKIGLNYRWLSRLHWYCGEADKAEQFINKAIEVLEAVEPGPELAWGYSVRSQWAMLNDKFEDAIAYGERAQELAKQFDEIEIYVHALNNVGTSLLLSGDPERGRELMDESLRLALEHQLHEQAARVYTNMAEYALSVRDLDLAKTYLQAGIAFDTEHDLDSWLHYLRGCRARYLMMRGELDEAEALARDVLEVPNQTVIMQLPAATVLAQVGVRLGRTSAREELLDVLQTALDTKEPQRIAPVRIALAEAAWLAGNILETYAQVESALSLNHAVQEWDVGELYCWAHRAGRPIMPLPEGMPDAIRLECAGDLVSAADAYRRIGMPFEYALVRSVIESSGQLKPIEQINKIINSTQDEVAGQDGHQRRQYSVARTHPAGLTHKEQEVLRLLGEGASNALIAATLNRSIRTVEHHVSAVLGKLGVDSRNAVVSRIHSEPHLLTGMMDAAEGC
jgi:DNA-binding CsgD family transcriptional regulator/Tfp pilus assembly protein PilF